MNPTGSAPPDKKKLALLIGLGLVIIVIYKQVVLKPAAPPPETVPADSGVAPAAEGPLEQPASLETKEEVLPKEKIDSAGQSWGRDPFLGDEGSAEQPAAVTPVTPQEPARDDSALSLSGIAWSKNKAVAIINGQVVREGDFLPVKGKKIYKVIRILKNRVILLDRDKTIILRVRGG